MLPSAPAPAAVAVTNVSYPGLAEYMGLELSEEIIRANMPEYLPGNQLQVNIEIFYFSDVLPTFISLLHFSLRTIKTSCVPWEH